MTGESTEMPYTRDLVRLGFESVADWSINEDNQERITPKGIEGRQGRMTELFAVKNALYAFCCGGKVLYIGKTSQSLGKRLAGYSNPGAGQRTNLKCNALIKARIAMNEKIEIFAFAPQKDLPIHCGYQVNLAAGLEDILILDFNPPWNGGAIGAKLTETAEHEVNLVMQEPVLDCLPEPIPKIGTFDINLRPTYYRQGIINPGQDASKLLGQHNKELTVMFSDGMPSVRTSITRNANRNGAVRLVGSGPVIAAWFERNFDEGDTVKARILGPYLIELMGNPAPGGAV